MDQQIKDLQKRIEIIELTLQRIEKSIVHIEQSTCKMDSHIDMVESVYENVKNPLHYMCDTINSRFLRIEQ